MWSMWPLPAGYSVPRFSELGMSSNLIFASSCLGTYCSQACFFVVVCLFLFLFFCLVFSKVGYRLEQVQLGSNDSMGDGRPWYLEDALGVSMQSLQTVLFFTELGTVPSAAPAAHMLYKCCMLLNLNGDVGMGLASFLYKLRTGECGDQAQVLIVQERLRPGGKG